MDVPQRLLLFARREVEEGVPVNAILPAITGTPTVGETLTASVGAWAGFPSSYAYQWYADAVEIVGATSSTYVLTEAELAADITVGVVATNATGDSDEAVSAAVGPVAGLADPVIVLTSTPGTNPPEFTVDADDIEVGFYYQLDFTDDGSAPDGTAEDTLEFTSEMALGGPVDWNAGPFAPGATIKWCVRYGPTITGPWSNWSNTLTDEMDAGSWTPANLGAKLLAWWDISDAGSRTLDGSSKVSQLDDLSGNANHLTQASAGLRPLYSATSWNSVAAGMTFSGVDTYLSMTSTIAYSGATGLSVHAAVQQDGSAADRTIVSGIDAGAPQMRLTTGNAIQIVRSFEANIVSSTATFSTGWHLAGMDIATNVSDFWHDGTEETHTDNGAFTQPLKLVGANGQSGGSSLGNYFSGVMSEIVITSNDLTGPELTSLYTYLDAKWTP